MAERKSKPRSKDTSKPSQMSASGTPTSSRRLLPFGLGLMLLLASCLWWGNQNVDPASPAALATSESSGDSRSPESVAAITRVASSLADARQPDSQATPEPADTELPSIALPTVTPTIVPSPVATRTIELSGNATLRLKLNSDTFESNGQPVTIGVEPHSYVLGGDTLTTNGKWCMQVGPTGLVFDLDYTLQPQSEVVNVIGNLELYDGFCGEWGKLGNLLSTVPVNVTIPAGSTALISPMLQVQGSFLGLPQVLDISTGVSLDLSIRHPRP